MLMPSELVKESAALGREGLIQLVEGQGVACLARRGCSAACCCSRRFFDRLSVPRRFDLLQKRPQDVVAATPFHVELRGERDAMAERRQGHGLDVVGDHIVALGDDGRRARRPDERDAAARAGAEGDPGPFAGGADQATA